MYLEKYIDIYMSQTQRESNLKCLYGYYSAQCGANGICVELIFSRFSLNIEADRSNAKRREVEELIASNVRHP